MGVKVKEKHPGSGVWWIYINHKGKRKSKKVGRDEKLAIQAAEKIQAKLTLGDVGIMDKDAVNIPTFKEYVQGWKDSEGRHVGWFDKVARLRLKNSTRHGYKSVLNAHLFPAFGKVRLNEITSSNIGDFIYGRFKEQLQESGDLPQSDVSTDKAAKKKKNDILRSTTIKNIKNCLSAILRHACDTDGYISSNPARGVCVPRPEDETPSRVPDPLTWRELKHLEQVFQEQYPRYYPLVLCGFRTGLRIGELIGLQWGDIDFFNKTLVVQKNVTRGKITTPKSKAGKRAVRMTAQLVSVLQQHRVALKAEKLKKGGAGIQEKPGTAKNGLTVISANPERLINEKTVIQDWVFPNEEGGFLSYPNFVDRVWNRALEKSGLRRRTPHDMRHTYATLRLSKGDNLAEVAKEMGHSTPQITFQTYYKWIQRRAGATLTNWSASARFKRTTNPNAPYTHPTMKKGLAVIG